MKIVIIGAGIAGLAAGVYARRSGFETEILEAHTIPGGNSTSWKRGGYLFEGGLHWLTGSSEDSSLYRLWTETGALHLDTSVYVRDPFFCFLMPDQTLICAYRDADKLERHLTEISPEDKHAVKRLCKDIKAFRGFGMPVTDLKGANVKYKTAPPVSMLKNLFKVLPRLKKLSGMTVEEYTADFKHPQIRALLNALVGVNDFSAASLLFTLGTVASGDGGYPAGGSLKMARNMADEFVRLGGVIRYETRADEIIVENNQATGVRSGDKLFTADAVILASDSLHAHELLKDGVPDEWISELKNTILPLSCVYMGIGFDADLKDLPENVIFSIDAPIRFGDFTYHTLGINNYAAYEGYAPDGKTAVTTALMGDSYDYWKRAKEDGTYQQKKEALAEQVIDRIEKQFPQLKGKAELWDIATPLTYERYTGTYRGSFMSVLPPNYKMKVECTKSRIPRLYYAGQRMTLPGGLPVAITSGRAAVQQICKDHGLQFERDV